MSQAEKDPEFQLRQPTFKSFLDKKGKTTQASLKTSKSMKAFDK
jgi:hypothetical protein